MSQSTSLSTELIRAMPKVILHEHLDGGLRPSTVIELAREAGIALPTEDPSALGDWFFRGANRGSLTEYLEGFAVTCSVMQTEAALERVAFELMEDMAADGIVYAEVRFAPFLHTARGLNVEQVMAAVLAGLGRGRKATGVRFGLIVCALRNLDPALSLSMAELAVAFRDRGAVAFDLAGDEFGHPPKSHIEAFHYSQRENFNITVHAGEAFGKPSIWQAIQYCGAHRIGHCTRLTEDMVVVDGRAQSLGTLAAYVRDHRIPLEICLSSNVHTGAVAKLEEHPFRVYFDAKFRVTLNTDNRLMSRTTLTDEYVLAHRVFGLDFAALEKISMNGMKSAFLGFEERLAIIYDRIRPGFERLRQRSAAAGG